jgi:hypothetical protein
MSRFLALVLVACLPTISLSQVTPPRPESAAERDARLGRAGAGVRIGHWAVRGLREASGATSEPIIPSIEAWHQRGIDRHVSLDNSLAVWGRRETVTHSGGITGGTTQETVSTFVVPMFTSVALHPFTGADQPFEPFVRAGAGIAVGIENRSGSGGALFGGGGGTTMVLGFALQGGGGVAWRFSRAFGLSATAGYRWTHFTENLGGIREYKGVLADLGLFYRFQYR